MFKKVDFVYFPMRAYGDFIITINVLKTLYSTEQKIDIVLPLYLKNFFIEVKAERYFNVISEVELNDFPQINNMRNFRSIENVKLLINEMWAVHKGLRKVNESIYLDHHSKRMYSLCKKFIWPKHQSNIYEEKYNFFSNYFKSENNYNNLPKQFFKNTSIKKIAIFYQSRVPKKELSESLLNTLVQNLKNNYEVTIAFFGEILPLFEAENIMKKSYNNFTDLNNILQVNDFIITSDSLPAHFAMHNFIPHFTIFNKEPNYYWHTPYCTVSRSYHVHVDNDNLVMKSLETAFNNYAKYTSK